MARCPSQDWDAYCRSQEAPEVCPVCGKDNAGEDGEWVCKEAEGFCSVACMEAYLKEVQAEAEAEARYYAEQEKWSHEN